MSIYLLPESLIKDIERMLNSYWWGGGVASKGIRWMAWERMAYPKDMGGMGFRDLHLFNMAMIAKQGWKFIVQPDSLVAKIYKARYFPNSSIFESHLGSNPSYAWRSIWKSCQVLMYGCRWRIGNGTNIKIMGEPWLREEDELRVQAPQIQGLYNMNVNELFCSNMKVWDRNKIESIFSIDVAKNILNVPLFDDVDHDKLVWYDDAYGNYSVKSGYKMLLNETRKIEKLKDVGDWKRLWKIRAPPKVKNLLWRICKGCLPTRIRLRERYVPCPINCPLCEHQDEDDWHVLFGCNNSSATWQAAGLDGVLLSHLQQYNTVKDIIMSICRREDENVAGQVAMMVWVLWNNRNNCVWNDKKEPGRALGIKTSSIWQEWHAVQQVRTSSSAALHDQQQNNNSVVQEQQQEHMQQWQKPPAGWLKCNVDAGFHNAIGRSSEGWCVRNHLGQFVMAGTSWMQGICSTMEGEASALLGAMQEMNRRGFSKVIFETDSKIVTDAIYNRHMGVSEFSSLICNIRNILSFNSNFMVKLIKRQANMVAHTLARAAISWSSRCLFKLAPTCIETFLINDMS